MSGVTTLPREDLTRKQRRELARAQRKAAEEAEAMRQAQRKRLTRLASVLVLVVVGIVVVLIASSGGGVRKIAPQSAEARKAVSEVSTMLAGVPQNGNGLGQATAPVTLQYYADLQCPVCRSFTRGALPALVSKWIRPGKLRIEYRSLETATREPELFDAQQAAALAAGKQNRMWNFIETFYDEQQEEGSGYVTEGFIGDIARQVPGLNLSKWTADRGDPALANQLSSDAQAANGAGLNGTPAFLIGRSGGAASKLEPSSFSEPSSFDHAIENLVHS
jgi:protein-disulfide isomerase